VDPVKCSPDELIGREQDMERLRGLLAAGEQLITIAGPPGIGKTRLATEIAASLGGLVIPLWAARTLDDVLTAVASAIGVSAATTGRDGLAERVALAIAARDDQLLVLDNFEQISELAAETVGRWAAASHRVPARGTPAGARFLVTSREVLRLDGEWVHELRPLSLRPAPTGESDAVRLLRLRAQRSLGGAAAPDSLDDLTEVAQALDGIPLALELAAQRVAVFGASAVRSRLDSFLDFLADGRRSAMPRRRTLRETIAWSWSLLEQDEQVALAQCTVFCGSFDVEAVERVLSLEADPLVVLQALREKSLVASDEADPTRLRLLVPIREFAREQLGAADAERAARNHTAFYLERAERLCAGAGECGQAALLSALEGDRGNLFAVLERARASSGDDRRETVWRAIRAVAPLVLARGPIQPLFDALADEVDDDRTDGEGAAQMMILRARLLRRLGRIHEAEALFARVLERKLAPPPYLFSELAYCKFSTGRIREALDDWSRARETRSVLAPEDRAGEGGDKVRMAFALRELGRYDEAETLAAEALAIGRRLKSGAAQATALTLLSVVASDRGAAARALLLAREATAEAVTSTNSYYEGIAMSALAIAYHASGEVAEAEAVLRPCQRLLALLGFSRLEGGALIYLGILAWERSDLKEARSRLEDALGLYRSLGDARYAGLASAALGAIDADEGYVAAAESRFAALPESDGLPLSRAIEIYRLHLDLAEARRAEAAGRTADAERRRKRVRQLLTEEPSDYDSRIARRLCLGVMTHGAEALEVRSSGSTCRLGQTVIELGKHQAARAVLIALVRGRLDCPARPLAWSELVGVGWPSERMLPAAAKNRLKVTVAWLRKAGFRDLIQSDERGYWLRPNTRVLVESH
jgi:predicted ATPase